MAKAKVTEEVAVVTSEPTVTTTEPTVITVATEEAPEFISTKDSAEFALNLLAEITDRSAMKSQINSKIDEIRHLLRY